jgi:Zn-finger nucleic acid-binding protein
MPRWRSLTLMMKLRPLSDMTNPPHAAQSAAGLCPLCGTLLAICPIPDGEMRWCGRCYGVWLDNRACRTLVADGLSERSRDKIHWVSQQKKQPTLAPEGHGYRRRVATNAADDTRACPMCQGPLSFHATDSSQHGARVVLDVCPAHGTWFDQGEAWALLQAISLRKAALELGLATGARVPDKPVSSAALCPQCSKVLAICPIPDGLMRWCGQCFGLWLDSRACYLFLAGVLSAQARDKIQWVSQHTRQQAPRLDGQADRRPESARDPAPPGVCPVCHRALTPHVTDVPHRDAQVVVGVCPAHGTWFDRGKALAVLRFMSPGCATEKTDPSSGASACDPEALNAKLGALFDLGNPRPRG